MESGFPTRHRVGIKTQPRPEGKPMLDYLVYLAIGFTIFFSTLGFFRKSGGLYFVAALFFLISGIGILGTGWQTYSASSFTITDISSTVTVVTPTPLQTLATLNGTPEQQVVFGIGLLFIVMGVFVIYLSVLERQKNVAAVTTLA